MKHFLFVFIALMSAFHANGTEISPKIYGGSYTNNYASVALIKINSQTCTGVLIGERVVLTAAHCVCDSENDSNILAGQSCQIDGISAGLYNADDVKIFFQHSGEVFSPEDENGTAHILVNANYSKKNNNHNNLTVLKNDIALIVLSSSVTGIQPANILTTELIEHEKGILVGFGRRGVDNTYPGLKRAGESEISLSNSDCDLPLFDDSSQFCVANSSSLNTPTHTCKGDSGSPIFVQRENGYYVAGVNSHGLNADTICEDKANYYTKISAFQEWINTSMTGFDIGHSGYCQNSHCLFSVESNDYPYAYVANEQQLIRLGSDINSVKISFPIEDDIRRFVFSVNGDFQPLVDKPDWLKCDFSGNSSFFSCRNKSPMIPSSFEVTLSTGGRRIDAQSTATFFFEDAGANYSILLLDRTGSMQDTTRASNNTRCVDSLEKARDDITSFFDTAPSGSSMAVWAFNGAEGVSNLTNGFKGRVAAQSAVDSLVFEDCTSLTPLADALCDAGDALEQAFPDALPRNRLLILSTDGGENDSAGKCSDQEGGSWQAKVKDQLKNQIVLRAHFWGDELGLTPKAFDTETGTFTKRAALTDLPDQAFLADLARITGGNFTAISDDEAALPPPVAIIQDTTIGLYQPGAGRFMLRDGNIGGPADYTTRFGPAADYMKAVAGDWDGDGFDTIGAYRRNQGVFYLNNAVAGGRADSVVRFGPSLAELIPVAGDWDGDGYDTIGIYRPSQGKFYLKNNLAAGAADETIRFGPANANIKPVAGDWDGDGYDTVGIYNPVQGKFYLKNSLTDGKADSVIRFGPKGTAMIPVIGDWDGDGFDTIGIYNPVQGKFYLKNSLTGGKADHVVRYGPIGGGLWPVVGDWPKPLQPLSAFTTVYQEDFSSDPNYLTAMTGNAQGKCTLSASSGSYYAEVQDQPDAWACIASSPGFTDMRSFADFEIEFDFNPVKLDWGHYPGIYFYPRLLDTVDKIRSHPSRVKFSINWSDAAFKQFVLTLGDKKHQSPTIPKTNEWYRIKLAYRSDTDTVDWTIKRQNGGLFHESRNLPFPTFTSIGRLSIGEIQGAIKYDSSARIRVDNLRISQRY